LTIQNARGKIFLTKERAVEHTSHAKKENPELALGVFQVSGAQNKGSMSSFGVFKTLTS